MRTINAKKEADFEKDQKITKQEKEIARLREMLELQVKLIDCFLDSSCLYRDWWKEKEKAFNELLNDYNNLCSCLEQGTRPKIKKKISSSNFLKVVKD